MSSKFDAFEEGMREVLKNHKVPYDEGSWEELQNRMIASSGSSFSGFSVAAIIAGAIFLGAGAWYFFSFSGAALARHATPSEIVIQKETFDVIRSKTEQYLLSFTRDTHALNRSELNTTVDEESSLKASVESNDALTQSLAYHEVDRRQADETEVNQDVSKEIVEIPAEGDKPAIPINVSTREGCAGTSVQFTIDHFNTDGNYLWNFGDGNFSNEPSPTHTYTKAGTYDITLSVTSREDGVIRTKTMDNLIVINPTPEADFDWSFVDNSAGAPTVRFNNLSQRAQQAEWIIVDALSTEINPVAAIDKKGVHVIELIVSNEHGCSDRKARKIEVNADYALMAPTQFSPDGDGVFDTFMPRALMDGEMEFDLKIYDGSTIIFHSTDHNRPWNGLTPEGALAEKGNAYTWVAVVTDRNGEKYYSGTITITP